MHLQYKEAPRTIFGGAGFCRWQTAGILGRWLLYFRQVTEQEMVDLFAKAAKPRLMDLLKLKVRHVYETTPGNAESRIIIDGREIQLKSIRSAQEDAR